MGSITDGVRIMAPWRSFLFTNMNNIRGCLFVFVCFCCCCFLGGGVAFAFFHFFLFFLSGYHYCNAPIIQVKFLMWQLTVLTNRVIGKEDCERTIRHTSSSINVGLGALTGIEYWQLGNILVLQETRAWLHRHRRNCRTHVKSKIYEIPKDNILHTCIWRNIQD